MKSKQLVIFGAAEQAEVVGALFEYDSNFDVIAYTVDGKYLDADTFRGKPLVPFEDITTLYPPEKYDMFVALGYSKMNKLREEKCAQARALGYKLPSYVSSKAQTWPDLVLGDNCLILEMNNIQPFVSIGNNVVLWSGNHIGHHSKIKDNCFLTSHVVVSGGCHISNNTFIGVNATLRDHIQIGAENLIAAGALVTKSTEDFGVYKGSPATLAKLKSYQLEKI